MDLLLVEKSCNEATGKYLAFFRQQRTRVAKVSNTFYDTNFDEESPLQPGCIGDLNREWRDFRKPWSFASERFGRAARQRK